MKRTLVLGLALAAARPLAAQSFGAATSAASTAFFRGPFFVVVWDSQDGDNYGVFGQRYSSVGAPLDAPFPINTYTPGAQIRPAVAKASSGDFVVAWMSPEYGAHRRTALREHGSARGRPFRGLRDDRASIRRAPRSPRPFAWTRRRA